MKMTGNKTLLITGGTGTFGKVVLQRFISTRIYVNRIVWQKNI